MLARPKRQRQADIDQRILRLHTAMADKLLRNPKMLAPVYEVLEQRYQQGMMRYGSYLLWHGILESYNQPEQFRALLLASDTRTASLRRQTILIGILSEEERQAALSA
ncbi:hypothetical protein [Alteromonas halophila]|uniref:Uncharacterized protein n=1 Tax=Alteromonas halophila TaxID=516698 RepID=A0A918JD85_9ALTE|nr:hypothetical protein [Alteromonas halophila]GGW75175.1 hypothetical protein GCM10007391_04230 [Alteromonas halophila]